MFEISDEIEKKERESQENMDKGVLVVGADEQ
jgi:hypothetical protein